MCTNRALVDSLECYMDDLVDCFEDFVKKSVIVISVAVGVLIGMIAYVLKTIVDRTQPSAGPVIGDVSRRNSQNFRNRSALESNLMLFGCQDEKGTCTSSGPCAENQDEKVLKNIGLTGCSKLNCGLSATRLSLPSLRTACKKSGSASKVNQKLPKIDGKPGSCCSMCCDEKCDR